MYSLPVTVVGLQMLLLGSNLKQISTAFLVATICSWCAIILSKYMKECSKPANMITCGLLIGLISSFFLIDYKGSNSIFEKKDKLRHVELKMMVGLALTSFGYTLASTGIDE